MVSENEHHDMQETALAPKILPSFIKLRLLADCRESSSLVLFVGVGQL